MATRKSTTTTLKTRTSKTTAAKRTAPKKVSFVEKAYKLLINDDDTKLLKDLTRTNNSFKSRIKRSISSLNLDIEDLNNQLEDLKEDHKEALLIEAESRLDFKSSRSEGDNIIIKSYEEWLTDINNARKNTEKISSSINGMMNEITLKKKQIEGFNDLLKDISA